MQSYVISTLETCGVKSEWEGYYSYAIRERFLEESALALDIRGKERYSIGKGREEGISHHNMSKDMKSGKLRA